MVEEDAEAREVARQRMVNRNRHENHTIYNHARTVKRCFDYANRVLDRYDVSESGILVWHDVMGRCGLNKVLM